MPNSIPPLRRRALSWACFLSLLVASPGAPAQVFEYGASNTSEGGGILSLSNNGSAAFNLEPKMDLRLAVAGTTVQVWVNSTNFNPTSPLTGTWTSWGTATPTPAGFSAWTLAQWSADAVAVAPGQRVGIMVRTSQAQGTRYQNPGPSGPQTVTGFPGVTLEFHQGLAGGTGLPTSTFGAPRGLNVRLYANALPPPPGGSGTIFAVNSAVTAGVNERGVAFDVVNSSPSSVTLLGSFGLPITTSGNVTYKLFTRAGSCNSGGVIVNNGWTQVGSPRTVGGQNFASTGVLTSFDFGGTVTIPAGQTAALFLANQDSTTVFRYSSDPVATGNATSPDGALTVVHQFGLGGNTQTPNTSPAAVTAFGPKRAFIGEIDYQAGGGAGSGQEIGAAISAQLDFEEEIFFADAIKVARQWLNVSANATFDANGWISAGAGDILVMADGRAAHGTYRLRYDGQADVTLNLAPAGSTVSAATYDAGTNTSERTVVIASKDVEAKYTFHLRFANTTAGVRNVKLMRPIAPGATTSHDFTERFYRPLKQIHAPFKWLRFMDYLSTNSNQHVAWSDRVRPGNWTVRGSGPGYGWQGKGAPYEFAILYGNETGKDIWLNVPHKANDDFVLKLARLLRYGSDANGEPYTSVQANPVYPPLAADRKVYIEFSNEIWNYAAAFTQTPQTRDAAVAEVLAGGSILNYDNLSLATRTDGTYVNDQAWMIRYVARRTAQISEIFRGVFGDAQMITRVRPVLHTQQQTTSFNQALKFLDEVYGNTGATAYAQTPRRVNEIIYGGGPSGYIYYPSGYDSSAATVEICYTTTYPAAYAKWRTDMRNFAVLARGYGIKRVIYEASGTFENYTIPEAVRKALQEDPRAQGVLEDLVRIFREEGGDMYTNFLTVNHIYGVAWTHEGDPVNSPRMKAVANIVATPPPAEVSGTLMPGTIKAGRFQFSHVTYATGSNDNPQDFNAGTFHAYQVRNGGSANQAVTLKVRASATAAGGQLRVWQNGIVVGTLSVPNTGSLSTYADTPAIPLTLAPGMSVLRIEGFTGSGRISDIITQ